MNDTEGDWAKVRALAVGEIRDYAREPRPLAPRSGQGEVRRATHKPTEVIVALKKALPPVSDADRDRMGVEIAIAEALLDERHVMPVLDHSVGRDWFVMPLAKHSAAEVPTPWSTNEVRALVEQVGAGLAAAHSRGWVHRDIKPANLLWLDDRWVVADWGLGRRPRGETQEHHTRTGSLLGTRGWAAPELEKDAHAATPAADIYSLGQVIGALLTGDEPRQNIPLLPPAGPWRQIVRAATHTDPGGRPQTVAQFLELIDRELNEAPIPAGRVADELLAQATREGLNVPGLDDARRDAARNLWRHAARHTTDPDVLLLVLPQLPGPAIADAARQDHQDTLEIIGATSRVLPDRPSLEYHEADRVIRLLLTVARAATQGRDWTLLEAAVEALFTWDAHWDRWKVQNDITRWLRELTGDAARIAAGALVAEPDAAYHFRELSRDRKIDQRIAAAVPPDD